MLAHNNLANYFQINFALAQHHHWSISEIEDMVPWERSVYVAMLEQHLKKREEELQKSQGIKSL